MELLLTQEIYKKFDHLTDIFFYKSIIEPILNKKMVILFLEGQTGEGKSLTCISLAEHLEDLFCQVRGTNWQFDAVNQVIYEPREYNKKIEWWLENPQICLVIDELRQLVSQQKWYSLLNQSISEANATYRSLKEKKFGYGGVFIYNSQDIGDITKSVRKTINYDVRLNRDQEVRTFWYEFWWERTNVEKPILRYKRANIKLGDKIIVPDEIIIPLPSLKNKHIFENLSVEAKSRILKRKREIILREISKEIGEPYALKQQLMQDKMFEMVKNLARFKKDKISFTKPSQAIICNLFNIEPSKFKTEFYNTFLEVCKERGLLNG
jgi:hypothetical protein